MCDNFLVKTYANGHSENISTHCGSQLYRVVACKQQSIHSFLQSIFELCALSQGIQCTPLLECRPITSGADQNQNFIFEQPRRRSVRAFKQYLGRIQLNDIQCREISQIIQQKESVEGGSGTYVTDLTLLGLGLIKINTVSANFNNPRPSLILNN